MHFRSRIFRLMAFKCVVKEFSGNEKKFGRAPFFSAETTTVPPNRTGVFQPLSRNLPMLFFRKCFFLIPLYCWSSFEYKAQLSFRISVGEKNPTRPPFTLQSVQTNVNY